MTIDIDPAGLCPKCRINHKKLEGELQSALPVTEDELCDACKIKNGFLKPKGDEDMARGKGKRKYTKRDDVASTGYTPVLRTRKAPKLDRETKKFIKGILKSGKKAAKLEAKAEKYDLKAAKYTEKANEARAKAASMKAGIEALKEAVEQVGE